MNAGRIMSAIIVAVVLFSVPAFAADLELGAPFGDHMILQRDMKVPVWGWSAPGTKVTVAFGGQKKTAEAAKDGKWKVELDALEADPESREMTIAEEGGATVTLKDVLVGEVWMCSGQSNMQWTASKSSVGRYLQKQIAERVEAGKEKQPLIREAKVTNRASALHPIEHAEGAWSTQQGDFSAIAFAFAYKLWQELEVPIGILNCAFSTTSIEAWIPRVGFRDGTDAYTKGVYQLILETDPATPEHKEAWNKFYSDIEDALKQNKEISTKTPGNLRGNRDASWMFNGRINPMVPYALRGAIWNQGYASQGGGLRYYENLHSLIRGWRIRWDKPDLPVYFHQFYSAGASDKPSISSCSEMRLGTWLARDIPNANMASQIDITGSVHYSHKAVPGQRLALHALKNQYGRKIVADGPMFKSYTVDGNELIVEFEHADGGLVVGETGTNAKGGMAIPKVIENGEDQVKLFYLADEKRIWYLAKVKIDGGKVVLTSPKVKEPRGVSYATGGVGFVPNLYNKALLPMTPFIYYDHKLVTRESWSAEKLEIDGETIDPSTVGLLNEWRKMPILSVQFRENAVLQAGAPCPIWGSTRLYGEWGGPAEGEVVIHFDFGDIKKTIPVPPEMAEWKVVLPPMKATTEPRTLKVSCTIDGEVAHERVAKGIVFGDVFYVSVPPMKLNVPEVKPSGKIVRMIENQSKRGSKNKPSRYSVCVSRTPKPDNRFASYWKDASGLAAAIGHTVAAKTGNPVGIIFMEGKASRVKGEPPVDANLIKSWIPAEDLNLAPSLMGDYKDLATVRPGNEYYAANARGYIDAWKKYWGEYIPEMIRTKGVPDDATWGRYPSFEGSVTSTAGHTYNVMTHCFTPAGLKGIIFLSSEAMVAGDQGAHFGEQLSALGNSWIKRFGSEGACFFYTLPSRELAPKISKPSIKGKSEGVEIGSWPNVAPLIDRVAAKCE